MPARARRSHRAPCNGKGRAMSTPAEDPAFPVLSPSQLVEVASFGSEKPVAAGDSLFEAGDASFDLFVVLDGEVEVVRTSDEHDEIVAAYGPGGFVGELTLLTGQRRFLTGRVTRSGPV